MGCWLYTRGPKNYVLGGGDHVDWCLDLHTARIPVENEGLHVSSTKKHVMLCGDVALFWLHSSDLTPRQTKKVTWKNIQ